MPWYAITSGVAVVDNDAVPLSRFLQHRAIAVLWVLVRPLKTLPRKTCFHMQAADDSVWCLSYEFTSSDNILTNFIPVYNSQFPLLVSLSIGVHVDPRVTASSASSCGWGRRVDGREGDREAVEITRKVSLLIAHSDCSHKQQSINLLPSRMSRLVVFLIRLYDRCCLFSSLCMRLARILSHNTHGIKRRALWDRCKLSRNTKIIVVASLYTLTLKPAMNVSVAEEWNEKSPTKMLLLDNDERSDRLV